MTDRIEYFKERSEITSSGCWEWKQTKLPSGYGRCGGHRRGKSALAHRRSWEAANGERIPAGMVACHKCDNPSCVNPEHIFIGTHKDNTQDSIRKGRYRGFKNPKEYANWKPGRLIGERANCAKLKAGDIKTIRHLYFAERRLQREIGDFFGVTQSAVSAILTGKVWAHVNN